MRNSECDDSVEDMIRNILLSRPASPHSTVFSDETFYSCTKHFTQLYTLHANVNGIVFPLVFGLLPNKSETTYNRFFGLLKDIVQDLSLC